MSEAKPFIGGRGERNTRWRGGRTVTEKGYIRIKHGVDRDKYVHRAVVERLRGGVAIPRDFEVHHLDYRRQHNCPSNLLMVQKPIHDFMSQRSRNILCGFIKLPDTQAQAASA